MIKGLLVLSLGCLAANAERFSFAQVGDIHASFAGAALNLYATNFYPWVLRNTNDGVLNIAGVIGAGDNYEENRDLTNNYDPSALATNGPAGQGGSSYSGTQLTNDFRTLVASGICLIVSDGNHDSNNTNDVASDYCRGGGPLVVGWNTAFPPSLFTNQSGLITNKDGQWYNNTVTKYTRGNIKLKFITLHTEQDCVTYPTITYSNQVVWAIQQMRSDPTFNCILVAHFFLGQSSNSYADICPSFTDHNTGYSSVSIGPGNSVVELGCLSEPNFLGCVSGHNVPLLKGIYLTNGVDGHSVFFVQFNNQQTTTRQNMNWVNMLTFDTGTSTVSCGTYTISTGQWIPDYSTSNAFTNTFFLNNFRHTFSVALPIRPFMYPVKR